MTQPLDIISAPFEPHAVRITTRKRQKLSLAAEPDEILYFIRKGLHLSRAHLPHEKHQILAILYPGDFVRALAVPPLDGAEIRAASETGEVWRAISPPEKARFWGSASRSRQCAPTARSFQWSWPSFRFI